MTSSPWAVAQDIVSPSLTEQALAAVAVRLGAGDVGTLSVGEQALIASADSEAVERAGVRRIRKLIDDGGDPLGDAFCALRSPEERRVRGATYTPAEIIAPMLDWVGSYAPARIVDPGAGSGRFAVAAGRKYRSAQIVAVELDPLAALLLRAHLSVAGLAGRAHVLVTDYRSAVFERGDGHTLYIGNPPYVRHHQIAPWWKAWLTKAAALHGADASQLAGLHVHFFLATLAHAHKGDRGTFITSSEWLDTNYGALVRRLLLDGLGGQSIHMLDPTVMPFGDATTTGAITCFEIGSRPKTLKLRRVKSMADIADLDSARDVARERLVEARRWTPLLRAAPQVPEGYVELGELCRVHRGAVTGSNRTWVRAANDAGLPDSVLYRAVTRARELFAAGSSLRDGGQLRLVVDIPPDLDEFEGDDRRAIEAFLREAKRLGVADGYIARHRRAWWSVGLRSAAPILATYMARRPPAFVRNLAQARHINIAHGLYPRELMSPTALDRLRDALSSSVTLGQGRTYAGGLTKFEPKEMERIPVPGPELLAA